MTVPSCAVTLTIIVLLPVFKALVAEIVRLAAASATDAMTDTDVIPAATVTVEPSVTVWPLTVKRLRSVLLLRARTLTVKV